VLVLKRIKQVFNKSVAVETIQLLRTVVPTSIITDITALLSIIKENIGCSPEILLPMGIIALTPFMLRIDLGAEGSLIAIEHEFFQGQLSF
jgi:hypothetical protein